MSKESGNSYEELVGKLKAALGRWVEAYVRDPVFETIEGGLVEQGRVSNSLACSRLIAEMIRDKGTDIDYDYLKSLPMEEARRRLDILQEYLDQEGNCEKEKLEEVTRCFEDGSSRKYLVLYFDREVHWIALSIMAASYVSAFVLTRSLLELAIRIATRKTGTVGAEIASIEFLSPEETKELKAKYRELCCWSHPYGRWVKKVCPFFAARPTYHPALFESCAALLAMVVDLMLIVAVNKFGVPEADLVREMEAKSVDLAHFPRFSRRAGV